MENLIPIDGYNNHYYASPEGFIYSAERVVPYGDKGYKRIRGRVLKHCLSGKGYPSVSLRLDGVPKQHNVHRLIALTFLKDSYFEGAEVNHKDGNKENNKVSNLEWVSSSENTQHWHEVLKE